MGLDNGLIKNLLGGRWMIDYVLGSRKYIAWINPVNVDVSSIKEEEDINKLYSLEGVEEDTEEDLETIDD